MCNDMRRRIEVGRALIRVEEGQVKATYLTGVGGSVGRYISVGVLFFFPLRFEPWQRIGIVPACTVHTLVRSTVCPCQRK